jgi:hypothetical protein
VIRKTFWLALLTAFVFAQPALGETPKQWEIWFMHVYNTTAAASKIPGRVRAMSCVAHKTKGVLDGYSCDVVVSASMTSTRVECAVAAIDPAGDVLAVEPVKCPADLGSAGPKA